jgi:hypothetical protein
MSCQPAQPPLPAFATCACAFASTSLFLCFRSKPGAAAFLPHFIHFHAPRRWNYKLAEVTPVICKKVVSLQGKVTGTPGE